jgi:hypothetical protein
VNPSHIPTPTPEDLLREIDRYLARELTPSDALALEQRAAANPSLRELLDSQRAVDDALRLNFTPPSPSPLPITRPQPRLTLSRRFALPAAAAIAASLLLAWWLWPASTSTSGNSFADAYQLALSTGFTPGAQITDHSRLNAMLSEKLGRGIELQPEPGIDFLGAGSVRAGSPLALALYANVHGQPVLLVLDRTPDPDAPAVESSRRGRLFLHSSTSAGVRLTEVSTSDSPALLSRIKITR